MQFAQDPKVKTPTMTELVSDLSLRYIALEEEEVTTAVEKLETHVELATLASVLFTITGHREWQTKAQANASLASRNKLTIGREKQAALASVAIRTAVTALDRAAV